MSSHRALTLIAGPLLIVGLLYWLTMPGSANGQANRAFPAEESSRSLQTTRDQRDSLEAACRQKAAELAGRLSEGCRIIVRPPYVLAGDLTDVQLERHYRQTIVPTASALSTCYFDRQPDDPITILLFVGERSYHDHASRFDGRRRNCYSGYYQKSDRRIVLNISTGNGTLAHELTHALAHFDFPEMPLWFDEGLASLHEQSEFSDDGLRLEGVSNWRLHYLLPAIHRGRLPSLESLISAEKVSHENEAIVYAQARYFCLYLQQRRLLSHYYRKFRAAVAADRSGLHTLRKLLQTDSLDEVDRDFRKWVESLSKSH